MNEYDSILKEEKKYTDPEPIKHSKLTKWIILEFVSVILVLIISYVVYYHTVLGGERIFLADVNQLLGEYRSIFEHLADELHESNYLLEGTIRLNEENYNYGIIRNNSNLKISFSNTGEQLLLFMTDYQMYAQIPSLEENYVLLKEGVPLNLLRNITKNFTSHITSDQYIKSFYVEEKTPIVEVNMSLKKEDIASIIGNDLALSDDCELLFTFKNHAITNEIIGMKVVVRYSDTRVVWNYQNGIISYTDNEGVSTKYRLTKKGEDFSLKIYREDSLYSVLSGIKKDKSYEYVYQVIDQVYTLHLDVRQEEDNIFTYEFSSNIEKDGVTTTQDLIVTAHYQDAIILEENVQGAAIYSKLSEEEREAFQNLLNQIIEPLRKFIQEYQ